MLSSLLRALLTLLGIGITLSTVSLRSLESFGGVLDLILGFPAMMVTTPSVTSSLGLPTQFESFILIFSMSMGLFGELRPDI